MLGASLSLSTDLALWSAMRWERGLIFSILTMPWPTGAIPSPQAILESHPCCKTSPPSPQVREKIRETQGIQDPAPPCPASWVCPVPPSPRKGLGLVPFPACLGLSFLPW